MVQALKLHNPQFNFQGNPWIIEWAMAFWSSDPEKKSGMGKVKKKIQSSQDIQFGNISRQKFKVVMQKHSAANTQSDCKQQP